MCERVYSPQAANVQARMVITAHLILTSPTSLSNGDTDGLTDIQLRRDEVDGFPLLPGTSLAGALRDYLWQRLPEDSEKNGWGRALVDRLFGSVKEHTSRQSWLFVDDAFGEEKGVEIRDGVSIDSKTRTATEHQKFDYELLAAGTKFQLCFEFWQPADANEQPEQLCQLLALALTALTKGQIHLGGRKRRGFGECIVEDWQVYHYEMSHPAGIIGWLEEDRTQPAKGETIAEKLAVTSLPSLLTRESCCLVATFEIDSSLLIRTTPADANAPDRVHLRNHAAQPVLSGTSIAGALRARAERITNLLMPKATAKEVVNHLFGPQMKENERVKAKASRLWVREASIKSGIIDRVQSRVKIDRFTGGSYPGALFAQQPVFGGQVTLDLTLQRPTIADVGWLRPHNDDKKYVPRAPDGRKEQVEEAIQQLERAEVGLLLLLLKDLWTGDLPLGGEASVGRGRLKGKCAKLSWRGQEWELEAALPAEDANDSTKRLRISGSRETLEAAVKTLATIRTLAKEESS